MSRQVLDDDEINAALTALNAGRPAPWRLQAGKLCKDYEFPDFAGAFAFMTRVAAEAERLDHHPDWCNVYRRVSVRLFTHDAGGITRLDCELAQRMDELLE